MTRGETMRRTIDFRIADCWLVAICAGLVLGSPVIAQPAHPTFAIQDPTLLLRISEFHAAWQTAWMVSEDFRRNRLGRELGDLRRNYAHCHTELLDPAHSPRQFSIGANYPMIKGARSGYAVCPSWVLTPSTEHFEDESMWRDAALQPSLRERVAGLRSDLIVLLERAERATPGDAAVTGQLVRFRIDARDTEAAMTAARACGGPAWWCLGLQGLVHARIGDVTAADSIFAAMRHAMPDSLRCTWQDVRVLLPPTARAAYSAMSCAKRGDVHDTFWWLSDPLYRVPANERLVEQERRRMEIALRAATSKDERYGFDVVRGGDAVAEMLQRYGWPSYAGWRGTIEDREHNIYIVGHLHRSSPADPYTSFEYTADRVNAVPSWRAVGAPFSALASDWSLTGDDALGRAPDRWWPAEHFRPGRPLVQLPEGQFVFMRRQQHVEVAAAWPIAHRAIDRPGQRFDAQLLGTSGATQVVAVDGRGVAGGAPVFLRGMIPTGPQLLAIEASSISGAPLDARTRMGVVAPKPLSDFAPNEIGLSDIAILAPVPDAASRAPTDSLLQHMLPRRRLPSAERRVTIYWESYGTLPADSAEMTIRIATGETLNLLRRVGILLRLAPDPSNWISFRWSDREARGGTSTLLGPVPVQVRTLTLDLRELKAGEYTVEVTLRLRDGREATTSTNVWLDKE